MITDTCFKCKYFEYNFYSEEFECLSEMYRETVDKSSAWDNRSEIYWEYDRDLKLSSKLVEVCKNNPCQIRVENECGRE